MENKVETTIKLEKPEPKTTLTQIQQIEQTNPQSQNSGIELKKPTTPDLLKVPKAFKYPERYRSPTDSMMSPVTKGLLARARKSSAVLPPSKNQIKDLRLQNVGLLKEINN